MVEAEKGAAPYRRTSLAKLLQAGRGADGRPALWVALVVGTLLNLINQGDAFWGETHINWAKLTLIYVVPFFVSLHGAAFSRGRDGGA